MLINAGQDNKTRRSRLRLHANNMISSCQDVICRVNFSFPKLHIPHTPTIIRGIRRNVQKRSVCSCPSLYVMLIGKVSL